MNKKELKLWEEYRKWVEMMNDDTYFQFFDMNGRPTSEKIWKNGIKPTYEGFMDWKLERLEEK